MARFPAASAGAVVVVGAGTAGCVVAGRLAEAGHRVALLEAGSSALPSTDPLLASMDFFAAHRVESRWWPALTVHHDGPGGPSTPYLAGRGLGGSSAVNGLVVDAADDDPALGPPDESAAARARVRLAVDVPDRDELGDLDRAVLQLEGGRAVGLARRAGQRDDIARASLEGMIGQDDHQPDRGCVDVLGGVDVVRLEPRSAAPSPVTDTERWVVVTAAGDRIAAAAVVLCAGALHTPVILQRSGVGRMVGRGVQNHPSVALSVRLRERRFRTPIVCGAVADHAGVQVTPLAHVGSGDARDAALLVALMEPVGGAGAVSAGADPTSPPVVRLHSFENRADLERLRNGVRWVLNAVGGGPLAEVVEEVTVGVEGRGLAEVTDAQLEAWIRATPGAHAHLTSSCAIGRTLDDDGQVLGAPGVFVGDASAFPRIPRTGPHLPTIIQAERLVARWTSR